MTKTLSQSLDLQLNNNVRNDTSDPVVSDALYLIQQNFSAKNQRDNKNNIINSLILDAADIKAPDNVRSIGTKQILQVQWNLQTKMKPLDFIMNGTQATRQDEKIATAAIATILKKGEYVSSFRDKNGMSSNLLKYGDAFRLISPRSEDGFPIQFSMIDNSAVYVDSLATKMRGGTRPVRKLALVYQSTWDQFVKLFPSAAKTAGIGVIPRPAGIGKDTSQSWLQQVDQPARLIEWCYYFDLEHQAYVLFAGANCTIIEKKMGKDYPYILNKGQKYEKPYIPVSHYMCLDGSEGFYNRGVLDYAYDLAITYRKLYNMLYQSVEDNVYPLELVNLPEDEADEFFGKVEAAYHERSLGRRAMIPIKQNGLSNQNVSMQPFYTTALINEAEGIFNRISLEFKRMGIYLDEPEEGGVTATEILSNIEKSNAFVREIMEKNASEIEFELEVALDMTKTTIKPSEKTQLNLTTMIKAPDGQPLRADVLTLGMAAKEFKARNWFFTVNSRSGVVPSNAMQQAKISQVIASTLPGSLTQREALKAMVELNDFDWMDDEATPNQPMEGQAPAPSGEAANPIPAPEIARDEVRFKELSPV